jgi:hypothetical protein
VGLRDSLDVVENRKNVSRAGNRIPVIQPVTFAMPTELLYK